MDLGIPHPITEKYFVSLLRGDRRHTLHEGQRQLPAAHPTGQDKCTDYKVSSKSFSILKKILGF